jgi:hypothetical protein
MRFGAPVRTGGQRDGTFATLWSGAARTLRREFRKIFTRQTQDQH